MGLSYHLLIRRTRLCCHTVVIGQNPTTPALSSGLETQSNPVGYLHYHHRMWNH